MKPAPFKYVAARSVDETLAHLAAYGPDAKILAGGQSLVPLLNMRLARPAVLIDINPLRRLAYIRRRGDHLAIGALARQKAVEESALVRRRCPLLAEAVAFVGHPQIRTRGTIGGSLAHADPSAELPAVVAALDGSLVLTGPAGERSLRAAEFFTGYLTTALAPDELLTEVRLPLRAAGSRIGTAFVEVARRHGDFALVGVAAVLDLRDGAIGDARLAFTGVGPGPVRAHEAEAMLRGAQPHRAGAQGPEARSPMFAEAARLAAAGLQPDADIHATAEYRREVAEVLARRALTLAWKRAAPARRGRPRRSRAGDGA